MLFLLSYTILTFSIINLFYTVDQTALQFNNATMYYSKNVLNEAEKLLKQIDTKDSNLCAKINFYLGNINFKRANYIEAIAYYKNSLRNATIDEAKHNLIVARNKAYLNNLTSQRDNSLKDKLSQTATSFDNTENTKHQQLLNEAQQIESEAMQKRATKSKTITSYIKNW